MKTSIRVAALFFALHVGLFARVLSFTAVVDEDDEKTYRHFLLLAEYLEIALDENVEFIPSSSKDAAIDKFDRNVVQLAWLDAITGVVARKAVPKSSIIACGKKDIAKYAYLIANRKTGYMVNKNFPADLKGKKLVLKRDKDSITKKSVKQTLRENTKKDPVNVLKTIKKVKSDEEVVSLVSRGKYDIGLVDSRLWKDLVLRGLVEKERVRIIWKSPKFFDYSFSIRGGTNKRFEKGFIKRLETALINVNNKEILRGFGREEFVMYDKSYDQYVQNSENLIKKSK